VLRWNKTIVLNTTQQSYVHLLLYIIYRIPHYTAFEMITVTLKHVKFNFFFQSIILTGHKNYKFNAI